MENQIVIVVVSDRCPGCFGVYSTEKQAYAAIEQVYGDSVKNINVPSRLVVMHNGEILRLLARKVNL